ncbi:hypothetical protein ACS0TY_002565 [Phlomoides rotata]
MRRSHADIQVDSLQKVKRKLGISIKKNYMLILTLQVLNYAGGTTVHGKIYSKDRDLGQNILLLMYLVNIHDFGHSKEQISLMLTDGTSLEHSPQSVLLHQDFERSQNKHNGFLMQPRVLA